MSILHMDGFDYPGQYELISKYSMNFGQTTFYITTSTVRTGTGALEASANPNRQMWTALPSSETTLIVGFAQYIENGLTDHGGYLFGNYDGVQCSFGINTDGSITVKRGAFYGTGTVLETTLPVILFETWQYIEAKFFVDNAGSYEIRVDGETVASGSSVDTRALTTAGVTRFAILGSFGSTSKYDDFYIANTDSPNGDFLGDMQIDSLYPSAVGNYTQWIPSGEATNWECVNQTPHSANEYTLASGENLIDSFEVDTLEEFPIDDIKAIKVGGFQQKITPSVQVISHFIRLGSSDYSGEHIYLPMKWSYSGSIFNENPDDSAQWQLSDINNAEFGIKKEAS